MADTTETPPAADGVSKEDFEKMKAALAKANEEAKNYRLAAKAKDEELTQLQSAQSSSKSEMEKVQDQIAGLTKRAEKAEREALVAKVAQAKKIPAALAGRLAGATQEDLEADADSLIEALGLGDDSEKEPEPKTNGGFGRPKESLKPGASSDDTDSDLTREKANELAESILKSEYV